MQLETSQRLPRLFFTETGAAPMMADRLAVPKKFAHIRRKLAIDMPVHEQLPVRRDDGLEIT